MLPGHERCDPCACKHLEPHCRHEHLAWGGLTDDDRSVLDFERREWVAAGDKERAIRATFGHSPVRHYARVIALLDHPAAEAYDAQLVRRLRRLRDGRRRLRAPLS